MEKRQGHKCARIGRTVGLLCAALATLVPVGIIVKEFINSLPGGPDARWGVKWGLLVGGIIIFLILYLVAALVGGNIGENICRKRKGYAGAIAGGISVALATLTAGSVALLIFSALGFASSNRVSVGETFAGLLLVWLYGFLPAILLGILYGVLVRWYLTKIKCGREA